MSCSLYTEGAMAAEAVGLECLGRPTTRGRGRFLDIECAAGARRLLPLRTISAGGRGHLPLAPAATACGDFRQSCRCNQRGTHEVAAFFFNQVAALQPGSDPRCDLTNRLECAALHLTEDGEADVQLVGKPVRSDGEDEHVR